MVMTNYEARKKSETLEELARSLEESKGELESINRKYLNQSGLDVLQTYRVIDWCITFANTKNDLRENLEQCINKKMFNSVVLNDTVVHLLSRYEHYHF